MADKPTNPIAWTEGMFLRPQHLQHQDQFVEGRLHDAIRTVDAIGAVHALCAVCAISAIHAVGTRGAVQARGAVHAVQAGRAIADELAAALLAHI